ncbi:MAG: hypothetical protein K6T66_06380 [Peptococcaceae bacterium]|nr:hypothetical protein [Peptococcaceae bacterium]
MFLYSIGRSIPLLLAGTFTGLLKNIQVIGNWSEVLQKIGGMVLIVLGLWFLWTNT